MLALLAVRILALDLVLGRKLQGDVILGSGQATVISKFCFDFNPQCVDHHACVNPPGSIDLKVRSAHLSQTSSMRVAEVREPKVMVALLDDEYFSFPEVSQVWGEANCTDVAKAAKRAFALEWRTISSREGQHFYSIVVEKVRPRWWYIALASCSDHALAMSYELLVQNPMQGINLQLSMDEIGIVLVCFMTFLGFAGVSLVHLKSFHRWSLRRGDAPRGTTLLSASLLFATLGHLLWLSYFRSYRDTGEPSLLISSLARSSVVAARTSLQILLMFLARGDVVCRCGLAWGRQKEMLLGMIIFGLLGLALEFWGDREAAGSPIEYMYDTRPGVALIAIEVLWFYAFVSRSYETWSNETRLRPRLFYRRFALALSLWFLTLPAVAALASLLAPWVRFRIVFAVNGLTHILSSMVMVYIYHIDVAPDLLEINAKHREVGQDDEMQGFLEEDVKRSFGACGQDGFTL